MTLERGCLAYYDAFCFGLVPCKVLRVYPNYRVKIQLTANRGRFDTYKRGEVIETQCSVVVPRDAVRIRDGKYRIRKYDIQIG